MSGQLFQLSKFQTRGAAEHCSQELERLSMGKIRTLKGAQKNRGKRAAFGERDTSKSSRNVLSSFERIVRVTKHGDMLVMLC